MIGNLPLLIVANIVKAVDELFAPPVVINNDESYEDEEE